MTFTELIAAQAIKASVPNIDVRIAKEHHEMHRLLNWVRDYTLLPVCDEAWKSVEANKRLKLIQDVIQGYLKREGDR